MKKIFLSLPMHDRSEDNIRFTIKSMKRVITAMFPNEELIFVDNFHCEFDKIETVSENEKRLYYLGEAIKKMGQCDSIAILDLYDMYEYFRYGCRIEREVAELYGLEPIILHDMTGWIYAPDLKVKHDDMVKGYKKACNGGHCEEDCNY